jgi:transcription-repair coupling factor (superfamily II helicase)
MDQFKGLLKAIGNNEISFSYGLNSSQKTFIISSLYTIFKKPIIFLTYNQQRAQIAATDLKGFIPDCNILVFPKNETIFFDVIAKCGEINTQRLKVIKEALKGTPIIAASIDSLTTPLVNPAKFNRSSMDLVLGETYDFDNLGLKLYEMGYERVDIVEGHGQYSIRGGIVDIFDPTLELPIRIEFFGDEIDSIRHFSTLTQRSTEKVNKVNIFPSKEFLVDSNDIINGIEAITQSISKAKKNKGKLLTILERLQEGQRFQGMELIYNYIFNKEYSILDYFNEQPIVILDEPSRAKEKINITLKELEDSYKTSLLKGEGITLPDQFFYDWERVKDIINKGNPAIFAALPKTPQGFKIKEVFSYVTKTMQPFYGRTDLFLQELKLFLKKGYRIALYSGTKERVQGIRASLNNEEIPLENMEIIQGTIESGFEFPLAKIAVISDWEIFGKTKKTREFKKGKSRERFLAFEDLKTGDYVVHESHGIGKYMGVERLTVDGVTKDYISLHYRDSDRLYIPTDQVGAIQRFIGTDEKPPKLSRLGTSEWVKAKSKVKNSIKKMAIDLLKLYTERQRSIGYSFSPDTPWQWEFEDTFIYEETDDQLRAIEEVKKDMEKSTPMDRLLCGDVGYGKTEVAIRAAFKTVMDGKQCAILVPTTVLAQQHYNTFIDRFDKFPVKVDLLSRFRNSKQQKVTLDKLKTGEVDIVIGTHRLLQKDLIFRDLGLLIVDEEQRFGVAHKERLKEIKKNIDVLTLTATPIPRTLHMAMVGIRDMSILENPPEDRFPVQTYVVEYNDGLIREAIVKEIARGGQVYFVYNRVQSIDSVAKKLSYLIPEAKIIVAHGQLNEEQLEQAMVAFFQGEYDVLLCTTIIETGMDIPNVNTLIVYDADKMGLSQLYQLRGRVGRSNRLGYSYFTYKKDKVLTEIAEKRLNAIKEFTEFGSGFKIALRDLEIRGAGNLLGAEQHGNMTAIGYDLYCKLLEQTISEMKGEVKEESVETIVDLKVDGFLPEDFIPLDESRIEIYKKIANALTIEELDDIEEEIEDRFGSLPEVVYNLLSVAAIRLLGKALKVSSIIEQEKVVNIKFIDGVVLPGGILAKLNMDYPQKGLLSVGSLEKSPIFRLFTSKPLNDTMALLKKLFMYWKGETTIEKS